MLFRSPKVSVLRFEGAIGSMGLFINNLTFKDIEIQLEDAFYASKVKAVFMNINCPGGAPTQAHLIYLRIRQLAEETKIPVYAFVEDTAVSAGYWLACAADEIYAQPTSMVGSIGIVSNSFGFNNLLNNFGVDRRVYATGPGKNRLDPFLPPDQSDAAWLEKIQNHMKAVFCDVVRSRRLKLNLSDESLESGDSWVGPDLKTYGLVDGFETPHQFIARNNKLKGAKIICVEKKESFTHKILKMFL